MVSTMAGLVLICCALVFHAISAEYDVRVFKAPPEIEQTQNFLDFERQRTNNLPEKDFSSEEESDDLQEPEEGSYTDDTSTESTTLETDSNSLPQEEVNKPEFAQRFLNNEKEYANNLSRISEKDNEELTSDEEHLNEIDDLLDPEENLASTSDDEIEDVLITDMPLVSKVMKNFLESERHHIYLTDHSPEGVESAGFNMKSSDEESSQNVDVCGTVNLDKVVDQFLHGLKKDIMERGLDKIKIPDIYEKFVRKAGIMEVKGYFQGQEGWAKNLSTIHRTDHVLASSQGNSISVSCGLGFSDLEFGYDKYKAKVMKVGPSGKIAVSISKNSILLNATLTWGNGTCKTTLDYLSLNQLGGFQLRITGLGPLNWLLTKISDWLFKKFHEEIREKLETTLKEQIEEHIKPFDCTRYLLQLYEYN